MPLWYQRILIYAFTSRNEGFGLTLLEAMASGNALVAARAGAAEQVVIDGKTGILVPPGDVGALTAALEPLMRNPQEAEAMGRRARDRAVDDFGIAAEARAIAAFYEQVWAGRHSRHRVRCPESQLLRRRGLRLVGQHIGAFFFHLRRLFRLRLARGGKVLFDLFLFFHGDDAGVARRRAFIDGGIIRLRCGAGRRVFRQAPGPLRDRIRHRTRGAAGSARRKQRQRKNQTAVSMLVSQVPDPTSQGAQMSGLPWQEQGRGFSRVRSCLHDRLTFLIPRKYTQRQRLTYMMPGCEPACLILVQSVSGRLREGAP